MTLVLVLTVPGSESELAADALWALGVQAVEERSRSETDDGMVELWTSLGEDLEYVTREAEGFPSRWRWRVVEVDDEVVDTWRAHAVPSWVTPDLVVVPSWLVPRPEIDAGVTVVQIDPGPTFGLGDHPSTVLSLRALRGVMWPGATVLDVGCGSGVLAVGAALLGASYVEAIDVSAAAVTATRENAVRNGVAGRISVSQRSLPGVVRPQPSETSVRRDRDPGTEARSIEGIADTGVFDVVVANILAPVLIELAEDLRSATASDGVLIVSGILAEAHGHVLEALEPMQVVDRLTREGWAAVVLRH